MRNLYKALIGVGLIAIAGYSLKENCRALDNKLVRARSPASAEFVDDLNGDGKDELAVRLRNGKTVYFFSEKYGIKHRAEGLSRGYPTLAYPFIDQASDGVQYLLILTRVGEREWEFVMGKEDEEYRLVEEAKTF
ncbi:hypothetical protein HY450_01205 [Candidatus Pacearchaeota archaeon]|nr:hypothetical protein [Candidatus Pacearchaeota archaeon]